MTTNILKRCPYCHEEVLSTAFVCKHCHREFRAERVPLARPWRIAMWSGLAFVALIVLLAVVL